MKIILVIFFAGSLAAHPADNPRALGIEEGTRIVLDRADYLPRPLDDRTPLIVRLGKVTPVDDGFAYQFHFLGFEPGEFRLADFLILPDGSPAESLGEQTFRVATILPPDHDGSLTPYVAQPMPWFGGYRSLLIALAAVWILGWVALAWFGRRRKKPLDLIVEATPPSMAEKLQPYLEAASGGTLDPRRQAELERLLTAYWRDRLKLPPQRMADEFASLRQHPEAGEVLRAVERWLHHPGGISPREVQTLLTPYRDRKEVAV